MKLLVAYINTAGGHDAVALGACLARTLDAELEICVVIPPEPPRAPAEVEILADKLEHKAHEWLAGAAALVPDDVTATTSIIEHNHPAQGLIDQVAASGADMIVIGGAGGGISGRHTLGTVVNDVLHSSTVPVAVTPPGFAHLGAAEIRELSVAIGQRPGAPLLFQTAVRSGIRAHRPIRLISLVALDDVQPFQAAPDEAAVERARAHAQQKLDEARAELPAHFPVSSAVAQGSTIEEAVASLEWQDGDVIMVGSSRLAAPQTAFLGSTAAKILRAIAVPMIVVPSAAV